MPPAIYKQSRSHALANQSHERLSARSRAETEFLAAQKKSKKALEEKERVRREKAEHVADLKSKRLAMEKAAHEAAEQEKAATSATAKPAKKVSKKTLPQFHRF